MSLCATFLFQRLTSTESGPKNPKLPQLATKFERANFPPTSAASAAVGSARKRVRAMSASPNICIGIGHSEESAEREAHDPVRLGKIPFFERSNANVHSNLIANPSGMIEGDRSFHPLVWICAHYNMIPISSLNSDGQFSETPNAAAIRSIPAA